MRGKAILFAAGLAALGLLAAGCGGGKSPPSVAALGPAATTSSSLAAASGGQNQGQVTAGNASAFVAFVGCMQKHGIQAQLGAAGKGGPGGTPLISIQGGPNGPDSSKFTAARNACRKLLPGGGPKPLTPAEMAQNTRELVRVAACMRTHGYPSFPDPSNEGVFNLTGSSGFDPNSPQFQSAMTACQPSGARLRIGFRVAGGAGHPCNAPLSRSEAAVRFC